jgi:hypothetical protein
VLLAAESGAVHVGHAVRGNKPMLLKVMKKGMVGLVKGLGMQTWFESVPAGGRVRSDEYIVRTSNHIV